MMKRTCENCNRPLLNTDTVCWHCGHKQPLLNQSEFPPEQPNSELAAEDEREPETEQAATPLILFYGVLTAIIILALLLVTRSLGQNPTLSVKTDSSQSEWISLNAPDKSFTQEIPAKWDWQFLEGVEKESDLLGSDSKIMTAVAPLGDLVPDIEYLLYAEKEGNLLVVARSTRLSRLSAQQAVTSLQGEQFANITVTEARLIGGGPGEERALSTLKHMDPPLLCDQYFIPASPEAYLVAACSLAERDDQERETRLTALESFSLQSR